MQLSLPDIRAVISAAAIVADTINSCQVSVKCISRLTNKNAPDTTPMQKINLYNLIYFIREEWYISLPP